MPLPSVVLTSLKKAREKIEEDVLRCGVVLAHKKRTLNTLVLIAQLPPEVLGEIFIQYRSLYAVKGDEKFYLPYAWIKITHVCYHFRMVALNTPRLWSTVCVTRPACVQEMITRSKQARLTIDTAFWSCNIHSLSLAFSQLHRAHTVEFIARKPDVDSITHISTPSAPLLRFLLVKNPHTYTPFALPDFPEVFQNVKSLNLVALHVSAYRLRWTESVLCHSLRRLCVTTGGVTVRPNYRMKSLNDMLHTLENMPALQDLEIAGILPLLATDTMSTNTIPPTIKMPLLEALKLADNTSACAHFLEHVVLPSTTSITLVCSVADDVRLCFLTSALSSKLRGLNRNGSQKSLFSFCIQRAEPEASLLIRGFTSVLTLPELTAFPVGSAPRITLLLPQSAHGDLPSLCSGLPLSDVQVLYVGGPDGSPFAHVGTWSLSFGNLSMLRSLGVSGLAADNLSVLLASNEHGLSSPPSPEPYNLSTQFLFPKLRELILKAVDFRNAEGRKYSHYAYGLRGALWARKQVGIAVEVLDMQECLNMDEKDVSYFDDVVKEVRWDASVEYSVASSDSSSTDFSEDEDD